VSANQKRLIAFAFCVMVSITAGFVSGLVVASLGASKLASVSAGGGAFVVICGIGVAAIGLFEFTDSQEASPAHPQQGAPTS
jgi:hypothetical protein